MGKWGTVTPALIISLPGLSRGLPLRVFLLLNNKKKEGLSGVVCASVSLCPSRTCSHEMIEPKRMIEREMIEPAWGWGGGGG